MNQVHCTYGLKWLQIVQIHAEKVIAHYDPHSNSEWGVMPPPHSTHKSWQVCRSSFVKITPREMSCQHFREIIP